MKKIKTNYDDNSMVVALFGEAVKCLEYECNFAAVAMAWSAVDHAIDVEIRASITTSRYRAGEDYHAATKLPRRVEERLKLFFGHYPQMKSLEGDIVFLVAVQGI